MPKKQRIKEQDTTNIKIILLT